MRWWKMPGEYLVWVFGVSAYCDSELIECPELVLSRLSEKQKKQNNLHIFYSECSLPTHNTKPLHIYTHLQVATCEFSLHKWLRGW